ncbi:MAG: di-heme oxidoredictase family protein [Myxococcota bacterium]
MTRRLAHPSFLVLALAACGEDGPPLAEGVYGPLGTAVPTATEEQRATFAAGEAVALRRFGPEDGLGPHFNVTFCGACHEKPVFGGAGGRYRNFLLVGQRVGEAGYLERGVNGVLPHFEVDGDSRRPTDDGADRFALRNPIPFFGTGLMAEITEEAILANADPQDADGDGISGRPNFDRGFVGRFGRKSQTVSIEGFIRGPLFNHLGITTTPLSAASRARLPVPSPEEVRSSRAPLSGDVDRVAQPQAAAPDEPTEDDDGVPDPEMPEEDLFALVSWAMLLAAPEPEALTARTEAGKVRFEEVGCASCHVESLESPRGLVSLYSDLLLHDMGEALADGVPMNDATGSEFRTQPLWGVVAAAPYMHDGRADTLDEAIRFHGGEAAAARDAYAALSSDARADLVAFLESRGGRAQLTPGLIAPDEPLGEVGAAGGPRRPLSAEDAERFLRGREVADTDRFMTEGLGPVFNGDACRACHFDPVPGGSGPTDVDVFRQAVPGDVNEARGLVHRFSTGAERPGPAEDATFFEPRQTPTMLGMGFIDRIPAEVIEALADPDDTDGDGVSGRTNVLPNGRIGRFGWKAQVPSTREFVRDAMSAELGLTVPTEEGMLFGAVSDDDGAPDPEITLPDLRDLEFWLNELAAPPPRSSDPVVEAEGEALFGAIGCTACHAVLDGPDGRVRAFSDFLLHDVQAPDFRGVPDFEATEREFRTPPLWGLGETGPWWHDGRSFSIEDAIARHEAEGDASRQAFEALSAEERGAVLAFLASL